MPKWIVFKSVDAFVNYAATVEAADAGQARLAAEESGSGLRWERISVSEFDYVDFDNIEPEPFEEPPAEPAKTILQRAESFISGFQDDEMQEGIAELLADLREAIAGEGR